MKHGADALDHHLQIWLKPRLPGGTLSVETRDFDLFGPLGEWCTVISPDGRDGSFAIEQGGYMAMTRVLPCQAATWRSRGGSTLYLHAIDGGAVARVGVAREFSLEAGDALAITCATAQALWLQSLEPSSRFLIFEFPRSST